MKSMLYVGAALMIGASIYGFVDYRQTTEKKEFKDMYTEPAAVKPVVADVKKTDDKTATTKETSSAVVKKVKKTAPTVTTETVPAIRPISEEESLTTEKTVIENAGKTDVKPTSTATEKVKKKKKKLSYKSFSRAAMREEVEVIEEAPAPLKKAGDKQQ